MNIQVERWFQAAPGDVFGAFADAAFLEQWMRPAPDVTMRVKHFDFRAGGCYRFAYTMASGAVSIVMGDYLTIHPPRQLIFTWTWEAPDPNAGVETLVTIDFQEQAGGTRIVVSHERFPDPLTAQRHNTGWAGTLASLATHFPNQTTTKEQNA